MFGRVAAPLLLGGLPFAPLFHANGGSLFSGSVPSTHCPPFTTHWLPMDLVIDWREPNPKTRPQKPRTGHSPHN
jgi:hypothetical protein